MKKIFECYLKGAYATSFSTSLKEGFALHAVTQTAAATLFPAAPRRVRMMGAYAAATAAYAAILTVRGAREDRPLEVLVSEANKRTAEGVVSALHAAQGVVESVSVVLSDARRGIAAAGGVSPVPNAVEAPVNVRVTRTTQEN